MSEQHEPPALPGEVWRGVVGALFGGVVLSSGQPAAFVWSLNWGWDLARPDETRAVFAAWAMAERARAERAEKTAAAERRLRKAAHAEARLAYRNLARPHLDHDPETLAARQELNDADDALRALGVEP